jgi:hypothetical protein
VAVLSLALLALWLWLLWQEGGCASLDTFLIYNQVGRFFPDAKTYQGGHVRPIWYYLLTTPVDLLPWTCARILSTYCGSMQKWTGFATRVGCARFWLGY